MAKKSRWNWVRFLLALVVVAVIVMIARYVYIRTNVTPPLPTLAVFPTEVSATPSPPPATAIPTNTSRPTNSPDQATPTATVTHTLPPTATPSLTRTPRATSTPQTETWYVNAGGRVNIRGCPSTNCEIVTNMNRGNELAVISTENDWHEIRLENGDIAYIHNITRKSESPGDTAHVATAAYTSTPGATNPTTCPHIPTTPDPTASGIVELWR